MVFAVEIGSAPDEVGASVEPKTLTMILIPAAAYWDLTELRWAAVNWVHSSALSKAPSVSKKANALIIQKVVFKKCGNKKKERSYKTVNPCKVPYLNF